MMAVDQIHAPAPAPAPPPDRRTYDALRPIIKNGRFWFGAFLVPDRPFLVHTRCPRCGGAVFCEDGDLRCLMCARSLRVTGMTPSGRVTALDVLPSAPPELTRVAPGQSHWTHRRLSKVDGTVGLAARALKLVPGGDDRYVVVETIATTLQAHRDDVRTALGELQALGLVESFSFASGYRTGWRRTRAEDRS